MWVTQSSRWALRVGSEMAKGRLPRKRRVMPCGLPLQGLFLSFGSAVPLLLLSPAAVSLLLSFFDSSSMVVVFSSSLSSLSSGFTCFCFFGFSSTSSLDSVPSSLDSLFLFFSFFFFFFFSLFGSSSPSATDLLTLDRSDLDNFTMPSAFSVTFSSFSKSLTACLNNFLDDLSSDASSDTAVRSSLSSIDLPFLEDRMVSMMEVARAGASPSTDLLLPIVHERERDTKKFY
mmetsp:Transcript_16000/g.33823  ORF Transcript_16000/g.33823 Transcript_16000/m.33823 type:complete len:231 (+) Transcript_16000:568-1260(+)